MLYATATEINKMLCSFAVILVLVSSQSILRYFIYQITSWIRVKQLLSYLDLSRTYCNLSCRYKILPTKGKPVVNRNTFLH